MAEIKFPEISLENKKAVLIDLDDTLYDYKRPHKIALQKCFELFAKHFPMLLDQDEFENYYAQHRKFVTERLTPQGSCRSRLLAFQSLFEALKIPKSYSYISEFEDCYWNNLLAAMHLSPSAKSFLERCYTMQIPVCIVTDMTAKQQLQKIRQLNIDAFIDSLVTSEEVGSEKPNPQVFLLALKKLGVQAHEAIMVGDHEIKDILGAEKIGIKAYKVQHTTND
jgi:FMN phosphatase YigB (HAD superfamily)